MPYKIDTDKVKLPPALDRRIKIQKSEHAIIRERHRAGEAIRAIARHYGVDKRLIQFILYPERQIQANKFHDWRKYYVKEKNTEAIRKTRRYRQQQLQPRTPLPVV